MVRKILRFALFFLLAMSVSYAEDVTFPHIRVTDPKGREINATLTFSDHNKAIVIRPAKGDAVSIPYSEIDRCAYEYTKHHRVSETSIATAPLGIGAVMMLTKSKSHWLEIDYEEQNIRKLYVLRMDKHDYLRILDALEAHTGKNAEILGNADKRRR